MLHVPQERAAHPQLERREPERPVVAHRKVDDLEEAGAADVHDEHRQGDHDGHEEGDADHDVQPRGHVPQEEGVQAEGHEEHANGHALQPRHVRLGVGPQGELQGQGEQEDAEPAVHLQVPVGHEHAGEHQQQLPRHDEQLVVPAPVPERARQERPLPHRAVQPVPPDGVPDARDAREGDPDAVQRGEHDRHDPVGLVLGAVAVDAVVGDQEPAGGAVAVVEVGAVEHLRVLLDEDGVEGVQDDDGAEGRDRPVEPARGRRARGIPHLVLAVERLVHLLHPPPGARAAARAVGRDALPGGERARGVRGALRFHGAGPERRELALAQGRALGVVPGVGPPPVRVLPRQLQDQPPGAVPRRGVRVAPQVQAELLRPLEQQPLRHPPVHRRAGGGDRLQVVVVGPTEDRDAQPLPLAALVHVGRDGEAVRALPDQRLGGGLAAHVRLGPVRPHVEPEERRLARERRRAQVLQPPHVHLQPVPLGQEPAREPVPLRARRAAGAQEGAQGPVQDDGQGARGDGEEREEHVVPEAPRALRAGVHEALEGVEGAGVAEARVLDGEEALHEVGAVDVVRAVEWRAHGHRKGRRVARVVRPVSVCLCDEAKGGGH